MWKQQLNLGVDIEEIKELHEEVAEHYFTKQECDAIQNSTECEEKKLFYTYWTLKESYIKYLGKWLSISLVSFLIEKQADTFIIN